MLLHDLTSLLLEETKSSSASRSLSSLVGLVTDLLDDEDPMVVSRQIALNHVLKLVDSLETTVVRQAASLNLSYVEVSRLSQEILPRLKAAIETLVRLGSEDRKISAEEAIVALKSAKARASEIAALVDAEPTVLAGSV